MSFPHHVAHFANNTEWTRSLGLEAATPNAQLRHGRVFLLGQIHPTCTLAFRPLFSVSIARGFFTWSVPRLLGATPRFKFVLSQLFRTIVLLFASSFISRLERERLVFILSSSGPLDCEAVIGVGTPSLVQFVGLIVLPFVCWKNYREEEAESPRNKCE